MKMQCVLIMTLCIFKCYFIPIIDLELARFSSLSKDVFILRYMDIPKSFEDTVLDCSVPGAQTYEWEIVGKAGSPFAGSVQVGMPKIQDVFKPWIIIITDYEYTMDSMLIKCRAKISNRPIITLIWILMKLASSTDYPYHPVLCSLKKAKCFSKMYNCMNGKGETYRGTTNITQSGLSCIPWNNDLVWGKNRLMTSKTYNKISKEYDEIVEAYGNHNYCRNTYIKSGDSFILKYFTQLEPLSGPSCYNTDGILEVCNIPQCYDCMFGSGGGYYPDNVVAPFYSGNSKMTTNEATNDKGVKVFQQCYSGQSAWWSQNQCQLNGNVNGRKQSNTVPSCLIADTTKNRPFPEDAFWEGFIWAKCIAPQCAVRQVWFALVDLDGFIHLDENNKDYLEIPFEIGKNRDIYFYHFGTTFCFFKVLGDSAKTASFASLFKIVCKTIPEKSVLQIRNPIAEYSGRYTLEYTFTEGFPSIEPVTFNVNFALVLQKTITIIINDVFYCPGSSAYAEAKLVGLNSISPELIQWLFTNDNITWSDVMIQPEIYVASADGLIIKITKITKETTVKVKATISTGVIESVKKIITLDVPYLYQDSYSIEETIDKEITMNVKHKTSATINWIFGYKLLQANNIYSFLKRAIDNQYSTSSLTIAKSDRNTEGVYTAQATENKCSSSVSFYVSIKS